MVVRNAEPAKALAQTLGAKSVVRSRPWDVVVGPTVRVAVFRTYYTDVNARLKTQAIALGGPVNYLTPRGAKC